MKKSFIGCLNLFLFLLIFTTGINAESRVRLPGHVPNLIMAKSSFQKSLEVNHQMPMTFILPLRNKEALEKLIQRIHDPLDINFGKYLSPEEFNEAFAPSQEDYDKVIEYAKELGLTVTERHSNRMLLNTIGSAKAIEVGFNLGLHQYEFETGRQFFAPDNNPEVPESIASILAGVVGLDNLAVWHSYHHKKIESDESYNAKGALTYPSGPGGSFAPNDLRIAYNLTGVPGKGTGQSIALFELASYQASDINKYTSYFGLPPAKLTDILVDGGSGEGIDAEVTLDIELALALAPESQIYVYEGPNTDKGVLDTYNRIATDNLAKQVSTSWGLGEGLVSPQFLQAENAIFMQMAAQGQTIYAAAGDSGAYDNYPSLNLMVDDPASQPYMVGVGGTTLLVNPQTCVYNSESVWNNGLGNGAGGGGVSKYWPIPSWQANVPSLFSKVNRNVPDVSLNADPKTGYSIYFNGKWVIYGGTSCAAPLWAAFTALVNQELNLKKLPSLGFANPKFYQIGSSSLSGVDFHDIITGNNQYYNAKASYDNSTGWGSFNGLNLFNTLTQSLSPTPTPSPSLFPKLDINMQHSYNFTKGFWGYYQIIVKNQGTAATSGDVNVTVQLPSGISYYSSINNGWVLDKNNMIFTRKDSLKPGTAYQTIYIFVKVSPNAPSSISPTAKVSGGGSVSSTSTDPTIIK